MRKIILTIASAAVVGFAGPALADMTLPAGAYAQAPATSTTVEAPAFYATVDQPAYGARTFHHRRVHQD